jgi:hypothetical protein
MAQHPHVEVQRLDAAVTQAVTRGRHPATVTLLVLEQFRLNFEL